MLEKKSPDRLTEAINTLKKDYGTGVVMKLDERQPKSNPAISTGSLSLDQALGIGGLPCGRIVEIYGPESSGKSTLALHAIAEVQKKGGVALLIDSEHAFDPAYAKKIGIKTKELLISQPDYGEQALEIADRLIHSGGVDIVVIDSVAALVPKSEITGEISLGQIGSQARLMSQALRKLAGRIYKTDALCIFINQLREKIGITFGNPEVTPGGKALRFYASVRLDVRKMRQIKQNNDLTIGHSVKVKVVKNKTAPPFKIATFDLIYGQGISQAGELIDLGLAYNVISQAGAWFTYQNKKLGQGREAARKKLEETPEWYNEILSEVQKHLP